MSIKNQRPLFISAAVIIGITAVSLIGLNVLVEHIANITPPSIAMAEVERAPQKPLGVDDALEKQKPAPRKPEKEVPKKPPEIKEPKPTDDAMRRVRNGKDSPDIRRTTPPQTQTPPPPARNDAVQNGQRGMPPYGYPPPYPQDPKERERFEQMMQQYGPPPGYYQPPSNYPPQGYPPPGYYPPQDNGPYNGQDAYPYDYQEEYYEDYGDYDLNSKLDDKSETNKRTAEVNDVIDDDQVFDDFEE